MKGGDPNLSKAGGGGGGEKKVYKEGGVIRRGGDGNAYVSDTY